MRNMSDWEEKNLPPPGFAARKKTIKTIVKQKSDPNLRDEILNCWREKDSKDQHQLLFPGKEIFGQL